MTQPTSLFIYEVLKLSNLNNCVLNLDNNPSIVSPYHKDVDIEESAYVSVYNKSNNLHYLIDEDVFGIFSELMKSALTKSEDITNQMESIIDDISNAMMNHPNVISSIIKITDVDHSVNDYPYKIVNLSVDVDFITKWLDKFNMQNVDHTESSILLTIGLHDTNLMSNVGACITTIFKPLNLNMVIPISTFDIIKMCENDRIIDGDDLASKVTSVIVKANDSESPIVVNSQSGNLDISCINKSGNI